MFYRNSTAAITLFIFTVISFQTLSHAQLNTVTVGSASDLGENCYEITPDLLHKSGGVWYDNPIDFDDDFIIYYQANFGTKDINGADGIALVFKTDASAEVGLAGSGIGYEGILNLLVVEFDTYKNSEESGPIFDHIEISSNGAANPSRNSSLAGPIQASATSTNIEDGIDHSVKIVWIASIETLEVYFDCDLRLSVTKDLKTDIFDRDSSVFFGFIATTGGYSNLHKVCFNSISFVKNLNLIDTTICSGEIVPLDATIPNGVAYSWSPTTCISNPNIATPTVAPTVTTSYTVTITDVCGDLTTEDILITVNTAITPAFTPINPICKGGLNPLVNTSNNGITGDWLPNFDASTTTTYTFTPTSGQCADSTIMTIIVNTINPLTISVANLSQDFDANQTILVTATGGSGTYQYKLDDSEWVSDSIFEYINGCSEHTLAVRDAINICNTQPETTVLIMTHPKFFTPNADGYNDSWNIKCLQDNASAIVHLYDRYGKLLFQFKPSQNAWNGRLNGMILPNTDYWFVVNYQNSSGIETQYRSHFSLRR